MAKPFLSAYPKTQMPYTGIQSVRKFLIFSSHKDNENNYASDIILSIFYRKE